MIQRSDGAGLALKTQTDVLSLGYVIRKHLDGHGAFNPRIASLKISPIPPAPMADRIS